MRSFLIIVAAFLIFYPISIALRPGGIWNDAPRDNSRRAAEYCGAAIAQLGEHGYGRARATGFTEVLRDGEEARFACGAHIGARRVLVRVEAGCAYAPECADVLGVYDADTGAQLSPR